MLTNRKNLVLGLNEIGMEDVPLVGGKNASLGEMYQKLGKNGIKISNGFAVTSHACQQGLGVSPCRSYTPRTLKIYRT